MALIHSSTRRSACTVSRRPTETPSAEGQGYGHAQHQHHQMRCRGECERQEQLAHPAALLALTIGNVRGRHERRHGECAPHNATSSANAAAAVSVPNAWSATPCSCALSSSHPPGGNSAANTCNGPRSVTGDETARTRTPPRSARETPKAASKGQPRRPPVGRCPGPGVCRPPGAWSRKPCAGISSGSRAARPSS